MVFAVVSVTNEVCGKIPRLYSEDGPDMDISVEQGLLSRERLRFLHKHPRSLS